MLKRAVARLAAAAEGLLPPRGAAWPPPPPLVWAGADTLRGSGMEVIKALEDAARRVLVSSAAAADHTGQLHAAFAENALVAATEVLAAASQEPPPLPLERQGQLLLLGAFAAGTRAAPSPAAPTTPAEFETRWTALTGGAFRGVDWSNLVCAGGAVLGCLLPEADVTSTSDIDLFVHGFGGDVTAATAKVREVLGALAAATGRRDVVFSEHAVTLLAPGNGGGGETQRPIQIIFRLYNSPLENLLGFDIDACCVAYDGASVIATQRALHAISARVNIDLTPTRAAPFRSLAVWEESVQT